ncbi:MAG: hypothetical protein ABS81_03345 [Pseudonocardia sp. SCN 72-86]|nr:MAG: hypothetical protein ABS81_03345 [Pseudonocardia sp. SCN 72-86]
MTTPTALRPGLRLRSQTCSTEVIVVRAGAGSVDLTCGGRPMIDHGADPAALEPVPGLAGGNQVGKRYTAQADPTVELLVTKAGAGTLADGDVPLIVKTAKPLPSSD